jgi:hypothetical protein
MPDLGETLECNNCGSAAHWSVGVSLHKHLPAGWSTLENTIAGKVFFCADECRSIWASTRDWSMGGPTAVKRARELGYVAAEGTVEPKRRRRKAVVPKRKRRYTAIDAPTEPTAEIEPNDASAEPITAGAG